MDEDLKAKIRSSDKYIGYKQTVRALDESELDEVLIAADADSHILTSVALLCRSKGVPFTVKGEKAAIGAECGIDVSAAVLGFKKPKSDLS